MQVAITDANIFIDLYELELLELFFQLPYEFNTTVFVLEELEEECSMIVEKESKVLNIIEEDKEELDKLSWNKGFSFPDKSILFVAMKFEMVVFSGEKKMKNWCLNNGLESHGILFILQSFIDQHILPKDFVSSKLIELMTFNQWLPTDICLDLLEEWSS